MGPDTKIFRAGEGQQKLTRPTLVQSSHIRRIRMITGSRLGGRQSTLFSASQFRSRPTPAALSWHNAYFRPSLDAT
jgi:hypothetical protein